MAKDNMKMAAYCGLFCGTCKFNEGTIPDLARDLRKELRSVRFDKAAEVIPFINAEDYERCYEVLGMMVKLRCKGCKVSSRSQYCNIAKCAEKKGYDGCWECSDFQVCDKLDFLEPVHGDAHKKNMRKINRVGVDRWVKEGPEWYSYKKKQAKKGKGK